MSSKFEVSGKNRSLKSIPWTLAEFVITRSCNHLIKIISTYVGNIKKSVRSQEEDHLFPQGETMLTYRFMVTHRYQPKEIIFRSD